MKKTAEQIADEVLIKLSNKYVDMARNAAGSAGQSIRDAAMAAKGGVGRGVEAAKGGLGSAYEAAKGGVGSAYEAAKGGVGKAYDTVAAPFQANPPKMEFGPKGQFRVAPGSTRSDAAQAILRAADKIKGTAQGAGQFVGEQAGRAGQFVGDHAGRAFAGGIHSPGAKTLGALGAAGLLGGGGYALGRMGGEE